MPLIKEDFYVCECGCSRFVDVSEYVIKKDVEYLYEDVINSIEPLFKKIEYKYQCANCGKILNRGDK